MKAYLFLVFFLLQLFSLKPVSADVFDEICQIIGDVYGYDLCISIIGPDPRSKTVKDIRDVALLAADASIDRGVKVQSYAKMLVENATSDYDAKMQAEAAYRAYGYMIKKAQSKKESLIAKVHPGANSVAYVAQYSEDSLAMLFHLSKLERDFDDAYFVLSSLMDRM